MQHSRDYTFGTTPDVVLAFAAYAVAMLLIASKPTREYLSALFSSTANEKRYFPFLDGLRGLSALWVAYFHEWQWWSLGYSPNDKPFFVTSGGNSAVPIFVSLSGFLIFSVLRKVETIDDLRIYAVRRAKRILPLYIVVVLAFQLCVVKQTFDLRFVAADAFMLKIFGHNSYSNPVAWTLYVEVLFYVCAPAIVILFRKRLLTALIIMLLVFWFTEKDQDRAYGLWKFFLMGGIAQQLVLKRLVVRSDVVWTSTFITGALLLLLSLYINASGSTLLIVSILMMLLGGANSMAVGNFFDHVIWRFLATISYSVYLWHPLLIITTSPIGFRYQDAKITQTFAEVGNTIEPSALSRIFIYMPALILTASVSYLIIERPFLHGRLANWRAERNHMSLTRAKS